MEQLVAAMTHRAPWNKGRLVGQRALLKLKEISAIRIRVSLIGQEPIVAGPHSAVADASELTHTL